MSDEELLEALSLAVANKIEYLIKLTNIPWREPSGEYFFPETVKYHYTVMYFECINVLVRVIEESIYKCSQNIL